MANLTKPSNIARGSTIQDTDVGGLYDLLLGTSNYDNIKLNGVKVWAGILYHSESVGEHTTNIKATIYNTLGGSPVFARDSAGYYTFSLDGVFTVDKTLAFLNNVGGSARLSLAFESADAFDIYAYSDYSGGLSDTAGFTTSLLILVFP